MEISSFECPKLSLQCVKCGKKRQNQLEFTLDEDDYRPYKVEVIQLQNEYNNDNGLYNIKALVRWDCPSCGVKLKGIKKIKEIPLEIIRETWKKCPSCDGNIDLMIERINLKTEDSMTDIIEVSAKMSCKKCNSELPFVKKIIMKFRPIWNSIEKIKKIKIDFDNKLGMEIDRE